MDSAERRRSDRRKQGPHRGWAESRAHEIGSEHIRCPSWHEQLVQFGTRYLFFVLGLAFFNAFESISPTLSSATSINIVYGVYFVANTVFLLHARKQPYSPLRYRLAMGADILLVAFSVLNDPNSIPPSLLVFIMIVLGNGMRYGMRLFAESLIGSFAATMLVLSIRYTGTAANISAGVVFLNLFGGIILVYSFILMRRIATSQRELEQQSKSDSLTGLMNRRALLEFADNIFGRLGGGERPFVVLFADLDRFKQVNDTHGHVVGDRVLKEIAGIMAKAVRDSDVVARYGGDEFVVMLENMGLDEAEQVARRIQKNVADYAVTADLPCSVTVGLGQAPTHGDSFEGLLERVDEALYHSKSAVTTGGICRLDQVQLSPRGSPAPVNG